MDGWLIALLVFVSYGALVILLNQVGALDKLSIQPIGPMLIWRTLRFRSFIDWLARPARLWRAFGDLSIAIAFVAMGLMVATLVFIGVLVFQHPPANVQVEQVIGLPAINPLIPLWYGIFGLAVAILVHEGCHGILSRAQSIAVRSVGLLLVVVPIGAFVEPDETEMRRAPLRRRLRIFSVGPSSNLVLAVVCGFLFSTVMIGSVHPVSQGAYIVAVTGNSPADIAGLRPNTLIVAVQLENDSQPLQLASFRDFSDHLANSSPGESITIQWLRSGGEGTTTFRLGAWPGALAGEDTPRTNGWVGVQTEDPGTYLRFARPGARIADGCGAGSPTFGEGCIAGAMVGYLQMPIFGLSPLPPERQWLYEPTGPAAGLGGAFWLLADGFYWLFWLNLMVGTFNALPMLPLDGGHMYRDGVLALLRRYGRKAPTEAEAAEAAELKAASPPSPPPTAPEDDDFLGVGHDRRPLDEVFGRSRDPQERRAHTIAVYTSYLVALLILWQFIGGPVGRALGT